MVLVFFPWKFYNGLIFNLKVTSHCIGQLLESIAIEGHAVFYLSYSITASMHKYLLCICQDEVPKLISPRTKEDKNSCTLSWISWRLSCFNIESQRATWNILVKSYFQLYNKVKNKLRVVTHQHSRNKRQESYFKFEEHRMSSRSARTM